MKYHRWNELIVAGCLVGASSLGCGDDGGGAGGSGGESAASTGAGEGGATSSSSSSTGGDASACRVSVIVDGAAHVFDQNPNISLVPEPGPDLGPHVFCNAAEGLATNEIFQVMVPTDPGSYDCATDQGLLITWTKMDAGWGASFGIAGSACEVTVTAGSDASGSVVEGTFTATALEGGDATLPHDFTDGTFRIEVP